MFCPSDIVELVGLLNIDGASKIPIFINIVDVIIPATASEIEVHVAFPPILVVLSGLICKPDNVRTSISLSPPPFGVVQVIVKDDDATDSDTEFISALLCVIDPTPALNDHPAGAETIIVAFVLFFGKSPASCSVRIISLTFVQDGELPSAAVSAQILPQFAGKVIITSAFTETKAINTKRPVTSRKISKLSLSRKILKKRIILDLMVIILGSYFKKDSRSIKIK